MIIGGIIVISILLGFIVIRGKKAELEARTASSAQELLNQATALVKENETLRAKEIYQQIMSDYPDYEGMESVQKELENLNLKIILSNIKTPKTVLHEVQPGESLGKIAQKYNTTIELLRKRNNLASDTIKAGQKLSVWTAAFNLFVDKSQNLLILKDADQVIKVYQVSTGENNSTPVGNFKILSKLIDPVWFKSGAVIPPESPQNVLGSRWLGFDLPGYGIHGTIDPENIGKQVTAGCIRMRNPEVEEIFDLIPLGTPVVVVD